MSGGRLEVSLRTTQSCPVDKSKSYYGQLEVVLWTAQSRPMDNPKSSCGQLNSESSRGKLRVVWWISRSRPVENERRHVNNPVSSSGHHELSWAKKFTSTDLVPRYDAVVLRTSPSCFVEVYSCLADDFESVGGQLKVVLWTAQSRPVDKSCGRLGVFLWTTQNRPVVNPQSSC